MLPPLGSAFALAAIGMAFGVRNAWTIVTLACGGYALQVTVVQLARRRRSRRGVGAFVIHLGVVIAMIAIAVSSTMRVQSEVVLQTNQTAAIGGYQVTFLGSDERSEPHRASTVARVRVTKDGRAVTTLEPRMNQYEMMREPIGTPDVHSTLGGDLYVSIASIEQGRTGLLLIVTPLVSWIWIAVLMMAAGGLIALVPWPLTRPLAPFGATARPALTAPLPARRGEGGRRPGEGLTV